MTKIKINTQILKILKYKNYQKIQKQNNKKIIHLPKTANKIDILLINKPF